MRQSILPAWSPAKIDLRRCAILHGYEIHNVCCVCVCVCDFSRIPCISMVRTGKKWISKRRTRHCNKRKIERRAYGGLAEANEQTSMNVCGDGATITIPGDSNHNFKRNASLNMHIMAEPMQIQQYPKY